MSMFLSRLANKDDWQCPTNWSAVLLEKNAKRGSGHTPSKKIAEYWNQGVKWVSLSDSYRLDNVYIHDTEKKISHLGIANSSAVLHPPGIVILSRDAGVGKSAITSTEMAVSQHFIVWKCDNKTLNNHFLYYWLQFMKPEFERIAIGSTIKTIGLPYFKKMLILRPPIEEQRKIAEILGAWDEAITLTERLIEAKQKHKKGLMQQLLTGKVRFPGFEGQWETVRLDQVSAKNRYSFTGGPFGSNLKAKDYTDDGVRIIQLQNIGDGRFLNRYKIYTSNKKANELASCNIFPGDIILSKMGNPVARAAIIPDKHPRYLMASDGIRLEVDQSRFDTRFVLESINSWGFRKRAIRRSTGTTRQRIGLSDLRKLTINAPKLQEQKKIASVLKTCDDEIDLLRRKAAALREQKKGLMQQLLTGKVRVKV